MAPPQRGCLRLRHAQLAWGSRTYVMGIVNVTPDSFSGDGLVDVARATQRAVEEWNDGADLLDFGGESTRPGHQPVAESTERARVLPVLTAVHARLPAAPLSIDSYKPSVVASAHDAGAEILNSVWGAPDALLEVAAERGMAIVAMHNQVGTEYSEPVVDAVLRYLEGCAQRAIARGIAQERVILDPGIGFGKTADQNLAVLASLQRVTALGFPTMLGASRKSTIGKLTGRDAGDRTYGTAATTALAVQSGIDIVRVHDVAAARDAVRVADAIVRGWRPHAWTG